MKFLPRIRVTGFEVYEKLVKLAKLRNPYNTIHICCMMNYKGILGRAEENGIEIIERNDQEYPKFIGKENFRVSKRLGKEIVKGISLPIDVVVFNNVNEDLSTRTILKGKNF